jgi:hypothetical protein
MRRAVQIVLLDRDENEEFKPFDIALSIDTLEDLAELVKRFGLSDVTVNKMYRASGTPPVGNTPEMEIASIWIYLEAKYRVFEATRKKQKQTNRKK